MTLRNPRAGYFILAAALLLAGAGCSSTASRISQNQNEFNAFPPEVQAKIRAGEVEVGLTAAQVKMALGEPDRVATRTTATGTSEVWGYGHGRSRFGFGLGLGVGTGGYSGVGAGMGTATGDEETMRVVLTAGRVTAVERVSK